MDQEEKHWLTKMAYHSRINNQTRWTLASLHLRTPNATKVNTRWTPKTFPTRLLAWSQKLRRFPKIQMHVKSSFKK